MMSSGIKAENHDDLLRIRLGSLKVGDEHQRDTVSFDAALSVQVVPSDGFTIDDDGTRAVPSIRPTVMSGEASDK
jgi:hypothetical protein